MINIYNHPAATELGSSFAPLSNPTFSGQITLSTGTAEAPALAFSHNTGLYQPVAGQLSASISGTPIAHVTSTGLSVTGGVCATGAVTAATVALSGLAGGSGPQYNYNYISGAPSQDENYLLAILPPSSGGTHEHILVDGVFGGFFSNEKFPFRLLFANRGGFSVQYETGAIAPAQIRAYTQGDGSIKIYLTVLAGYYATASLNIPLALGGGLVIYPPGGTAAAPTGTLVFSTGTAVPGYRVTNDGNLLVGTATGSNHTIVGRGAAEGDVLLHISSPTYGVAVAVHAAAVGGASGAATILAVQRHSITGRSINAAGTINASGADYAEYREVITALYGTVSKGALLGVTAAGLLTDRFADVVGRVYIKSTAPNLVGGDGWGTEANICAKYDVEAPGARPDDSADAEGLTTWAARMAAFNTALETERRRWDRVAISGIVPANITGLTTADIGKYLVPVPATDGGIAAVAVAAGDLTLPHYIQSFGVIEGFHPDGRPLVVVKIS